MPTRTESMPGGDPGDDLLAPSVPGARPLAPLRTDHRTFWPEFTPTWINVATLLAGHRPPRLEGGFRAVYLGTGRRIVAPVVAACHPDAEVITWDIGPSETEAVRRAGEAAQLDNLMVDEDALPPSPGKPAAEIVVVDQVLDSVSDERRAAILDSIASLVRPGGLVCVAYRTSIGWSETVPVIRLLRYLAARDARPSAVVVDDARALLEHLREGGAEYLTQRPVVAAWLEHVLASDATGVAADYIDRNLRPISHAWLAARLRGLGCSYIGSARLGDPSALQVSPKLGAAARDARSDVLRETITDLAIARSSRVDLFRLGAAPLTARHQASAISSLHLVGLPAPKAAEHRSPLEAHVAEALDRGPVQVADLSPSSKQRNALVGRLLSERTAHPVSVHGLEAGTSPRARQLNRYLTDGHLPSDERVLAAPSIGSAISASPRPSRQLLERLGLGRR